MYNQQMLNILHKYLSLKTLLHVSVTSCIIIREFFSLCQSYKPIKIKRFVVGVTLCSICKIYNLFEYLFLTSALSVLELLIAFF